MSMIDVTKLALDFVNRVKDRGISIGQNELTTFLNNVGNSELPFIKSQYDIITSTIDSFNKKEISKEDCQSIFSDVMKLWQMEALKEQLAIKNLVNGLVTDLINMVLGSILK